MQDTKSLMNAVLNCGRLSAIGCLAATALHAEDASFEEITTSDYFKALKTPALVEVEYTQRHDDAEQIKMAKKDARRIYELLMKDEMPELSIADTAHAYHVNGLELRSHDENGLSVVFRYDKDYHLIHVYIGESNSDIEFPARPEAIKNPAETFEKVFGRPPAGKLRTVTSKSSTGEIDGGRATWETTWPEEVDYEGGLPSTSLGWHESKGAVRLWDLKRGAKADLTKQVAGLFKEKPVKITKEQAIAAAYKSTLGLGFSVSTRQLPSVKLCYYNLPDVSLDKKRWRNQNRADVDGTSAMYGMHIRFRIPDSFSGVHVIVDHQTGEVLYVGTSFED